MRKSIKKITASFIAIIMLLCMANVVAFAANEKTMSINLRVEGISSNVYYKTIRVPYTDELTLKEALLYISGNDKNLTIKGLETNYITEINGEAAGKFGGWDGWLFKVNNKDLTDGIDSVNLSNGDNILFYYGDPFGVGMQFPAADISDIENGIIKFTSKDVTYDMSGSPSEKINPVSGMTVVWGYGNSTVNYVTDENGAIKIDEDKLTAGKHSLQVSKYADNGLPLVLRFAPDCSIIIEEKQDAGNDVTEPENVPNNNKNAPTNDIYIIYYVLMSGSFAAIFIFAAKKSSVKDKISNK